MSAKTGISWTDSTWNPVTGCSKVSAGCKHCYAEREWPRFYGQTEVVVPLPHGPIVAHGVRLTEMAIKRPFTHVLCHEHRLEHPIRWQRPRRIFVNSMSDLFHADVPDTFIDQVFAVMAVCRRHTFQVLTKRPERMRSYLADEYVHDRILAHEIRISGAQEPADWPLPNVWLGISAENQPTADERVPLLLQTPAAVRFVSAEPLLGPIDLRRWLTARCACGQAAPCDRHLDQPRPRVDWALSVASLAGKRVLCTLIGFGCFAISVCLRVSRSFSSNGVRGFMGRWCPIMNMRAARAWRRHTTVPTRSRAHACWMTVTAKPQ